MGLGIPHGVANVSQEVFAYAEGLSYGRAQTNQDFLRGIMANPEVAKVYNSKHIRDVFESYEVYKYRQETQRTSYIVTPSIVMPEFEVEPPTKNKILWVGFKPKGSELLKKVAASNPKLKFHAVFYGVDKQYEEFCDGLPDNVSHVNESYPEQELAKLMSMYKYGIVTSPFETYSLLTAEHLLYHPTILMVPKKGVPWQGSFESVALVQKEPDLKIDLAKLEASYNAGWSRKQHSPERLAKQWKLLGTKSSRIVKTHSTKPKAVLVTEELLKKSKRASAFEILQALGWKDVLSAQRAFLRLKEFFIKEDSADGTFYSYK